MTLANQLYGADTTTEPSQGPTDVEPTTQMATPDAEQEPETLNSETDSTESVEANPSKPRRVVTELNGQEIELDVLNDDVDIDLIPKSLMMEKHFRKGTMELADDRRALEEKAKEQDQALVQLNELIAWESQQLQSNEMQELKEVDPEQFEKARFAVEKKVSEFKKFQEDRSKDLQKQQADLLKADRARITDFIPEWSDKKAIDTDMKKIETYMTEKLGFDDEQITQLTSSAMSPYMAILRDASMLYEIQNASVETHKQRKATKTSTPNTTVNSDEAPKREQTYAELIYGKD